MKYGILGGTFDPPHLGHLHVAKAALAGLGLDEIIWVPAATNPFKDQKENITAARKRFEMVKLTIENEPNMSVSDLEITRGGASYTADTLQEMQMVLKGDFWIVIGADNLSEFMTWYQAEKILRTSRVAVFSRPGIDLDNMLPRLSEFLTPKLDVIPIEPVDISATSIRKRVQKEESIEAQVTPAVWEYIQKTGLYKTK